MTGLKIDIGVIEGTSIGPGNEFSLGNWSSDRSSRLDTAQGRELESTRQRPRSHRFAVPWVGPKQHTVLMAELLSLAA